VTSRRILLIPAVLVLASCSNVCSVSTSAPSSHASPSAVSKPPVADASCKGEAGSHSINSNTSTTFKITNRTSETLTVFWLNFQGQRVKYFDLAQGETRSQGTFVTHPWVVADPNGTCIRLFLVTSPTQITI
jgi:hypothetical protein